MTDPWLPLRALMAATFHVRESAITPDAVAGDGAWDSLNHVLLMLALEKVLGVRFTKEEMREATSVRALLALIVKAEGQSE